nr:hypothetical protein [Tanacetum cinerariifolium]
SLYERKTIEDVRHREMQERMTKYVERQARILALLKDMARLSQLPSHSPGVTTSAPPAVRGDTRMYVRTVSTSTTGTSHSDTPIVRDATETALPTDASDLSTPD